MKTPMDNRVIARIAREQGPRLIEQTIKALVAGAVVQEEITAERASKKPSFGKRIASAALVRVATRSVPGAIIVSGGLLAKVLHDRHKARQLPKSTAGIRGKLRRQVP
jgi:hypothetical protein